MYFSFFKPGHFERYHKYHHHHHHHHHHQWQISCATVAARSIFGLSHIWVKADIPLSKIVLHAPGPGCSMVFLWYFLSGRGFLIVARKALRQSSSGEASATWPNKYSWFKRVMSSDKIKQLTCNRTCWCKLQSFLNSVPFFNKSPKF